MCQSCSSNADCEVSHPGARAPSPLFPRVSTVPFPPSNCSPRPPQTGSGLTCYKTFRGGPFPFTVPGCSGAAADNTHYCTDVPTNHLNYVTSDPAPGTALQSCEADCNSHDECEGALRCFQRGAV